jgi:hypothetical protein
MSKMIEIDFRPDEATLRQFGFIAVAGFGFLATIAWLEWLIFAFGLGPARPIVAGTFVGLGVLSLGFSLVYPKANRPIYVGLAVAAFPIGFVLSYVIMGVLFFGLFAPVGLFFRLTGRDALHRSFEPEAESYFVPARAARERESYFKQF